MGEILHCTVDELRTVIGGNDLHSWREARLECIELVLDRCDRFAGIFARAKNDDTARHFAFAVEFGNAASHFRADRSEEHTSELQSLMRTSYAVFCLKKKKTQ